MTSANQKIRTSLQSNQGMTFVEAMIAVVVILTVIVISSESLTKSHALWDTAAVRMDLQLTGKKALEYMEAELRNATLTAAATPPNINIDAGQDLVTFYLPDDLDTNGTIVDAVGNTEWGTAAIQYQHDTEDNQLIRIEGGNERVLANNVISVVFDDQSTDATLYANEMKITLNMQKINTEQKTISESFVSVIKVRN